MTKKPRKVSSKLSVITKQQSNINLSEAYLELIYAYFDLQRQIANQDESPYSLAEEEITNDKGL